jgi:hypothetical protein
MGFTELCALCGVSRGVYGNESEDGTSSEIAEWSLRNIILSCQLEKITNCSMGHDNGYCILDNKKFMNLHTADRTKNILCNYNAYYGIFVHEDCYLFANKKLKTELNFNMFPWTKLTLHGTFDGINYKGVEQYWGQYFNTTEDDISNSKDMWMISSPLYNTKNAARISNIMSQLKLKSHVSRTGPSISATMVPEKTCAIVNDGNVWTISGNRWTKLKTDKFQFALKCKNSKNKKQWRGNKNIFFKGEYSNDSLYPVFIDTYITNNNDYAYSMLGTVENINLFKKTMIIARDNNSITFCTK